MNDCQNAEMRDQLPDLLHDRLDAAARAMLTAHVASCTDCREELALLRVAYGTLIKATPRVDLNFIVEQHSWLGAARQVLLATGDCSNIDWKFLGLTMPMWCLVWFVALGLWALYAGWKRREKHRFHR